jgi:hypothetical protein
MLISKKAYFILRKCRYTLSFRDKSGGYYVGDKGCFQLENMKLDGKSEDFLGGVWISAKQTKAPRLYGVVGGNEADCRSMGILICHLSKLEYGRFRLNSGEMSAEAVAAIKVRVPNQ